MSEKRIDLLSLDTNELTGLLMSWNEPVYRVKQLQKWLYRELVEDFDAMSNLPQSLRARLAQETAGSSHGRYDLGLATDNPTLCSRRR